MAPVSSHPPPPRRLNYDPPKPYLPYSSTQPPTNETWGAWFKRKGSSWGNTAVEKGIVISDNVGGKVNGFAETWLGAGRFWPTSGDGIREMEKCAGIIRDFTERGVGFNIKWKNPKTKKVETKKVMRKIPVKIMRQAKGIVVFSAMRNGIAPFGGAGGSGVIMAKLEDGTWSAPSFISPNNLTVGAMLGLDFYDCILILRTQEAVDSFRTHKVTLGGEIAVAAGPYGHGISAESGVDRQPVLSYVRTRGLYAGVEVVAQAFLSRFDENERVYFWPGIIQGDILAGRVRLPREAECLLSALDDAESGRAQRAHGAENEFEEDGFPWEEVDGSSIELGAGETLKLPPTPDQLEREEADEEWLRQKEARRDAHKFLR
ncbi:hypothetical protein JCM8097_002526 [Rhodosporidiobolus ruineniae]